MSEGLGDNHGSSSDQRHGRYISGGDDSIDGEQLANACRRLGISGPLEPLMREMKKDSHNLHQHHHHHHHHHNSSSPNNNKDSGGHHHRKCGQKSERKSSATRNKEHHHLHDDAVTDISGYPLHGMAKTTGGNKTSTYGQESWGRDSGARDLSPEPHSHRLPASSGTDSQLTDNEGGGAGTTNSMIHLANKLQVAALSALKTEVLELSARLQNSERERECMQRKLNDAVDERERAQRRLESIGSAHESRITEMHCVIVELNKKLKSRQDNAIMEENEPEGSVSDLSFQDGSVYNSEMECTNLEQESQTEPLDIKLVQPIPRSCDSPGSLPPPAAATSASTQIQIQAMHEEILHLRGQVALLQSQLASDRDKRNNDDERNDDGTNPDNDPPPLSPRDRSAYTSDDLCETAEIFGVPSHPATTTTLPVTNDDMEYIRQATAKYAMSPKMPSSSPRGISPIVHLYGSINSLNKPHQQHHHQKNLTSEMPVSKMAERVRLRRTIEEPTHRHITGTDLINSADDGGGICSIEIAEHLVSDLLRSDMNGSGGGGLDTNHLQNELQRLHRRIEHVRVQNSVLSLTLGESKAHCNHLYLLCGKYESNAVALHQALNCSDRAIEAYDVMLALLESRLGILECGGNSGNEGASPLSTSAYESRHAAEAVARHLIDRLDSEKNLQGTSLGPWHDAIIISANSPANSVPWTETDDLRLRGHVSKLKGQRASIQNTVVTLEAPFCDSDSDRRAAATAGGGNDQVTLTESRRMDLETAVLMQELMSMREELSEYKFRAEQAEREKNNTIQRLSVMQEALLHLQAQLADSEALLAMNNKDRSSYSEAEHSAGIERELVEALARESRLKARLQGLAGSLQAATKSSEEKYIQVQNTVAELKQTNLSLTQSLERCKRKYQSRLRRLEQQMSELSVKKDTSQLLLPSATNTTSVSTAAAGIGIAVPQKSQSPMNLVPETTL